MFGIISGALNLASHIFQYMDTQASRKWLNRLTELRLAIIEEEDRGYDSDDAKIEAMSKELVVILDAAQQELAIFQAKKS